VALGVSIAAMRTALTGQPERYRYRAEDGFGLLFDTKRFEIHILSGTETLLLAVELAAVPR
jgi:hypothetical protein